MNKVKMKKGKQEVDVMPSEVQTMTNRGYKEVKSQAKEVKKDVKV